MGAVVAFVGGMFLAAICIGVLNVITAIAKSSARSFRRAGRLIREVQNQEGTCNNPHPKAKSPRPT